MAGFTAASSAKTGLDLHGFSNYGTDDA